MSININPISTVGICQAACRVKGRAQSMGAASIQGRRTPIVCREGHLAKDGAQQTIASQSRTVGKLRTPASLSESTKRIDEWPLYLASGRLFRTLPKVLSGST
jgi:hypothetical protein